MMSNITKDIHLLYLQSQLSHWNSYKIHYIRFDDYRQRDLAELMMNTIQEQINDLSNNETNVFTMLNNCLKAITGGQRIEDGYTQSFGDAFVNEIRKTLGQ